MNTSRQGMSEEVRLTLAMYEANEFPLVRHTSFITTHIAPFEADAEVKITDQLDYFASHAGDPQGFLAGLKDQSFYSGHISSYLTGEFNNFLRFMKKCKVSGIEDISADYTELKTIAESQDLILRETISKFENFVDEFISANNEDVEYIEKAFEAKPLHGRLVVKLPFSTAMLVSVIPHHKDLKCIIADRPGNIIESVWNPSTAADVTKGLLLWKSEDSGITDEDRLNFLKKIGRSRMIISHDDIKIIDMFSYQNDKGEIVINFLRTK